jgi:glycosyltransferase involved in cell wall biosynthesis
LAKEGRRTVVLEERWLNELKDWLSNDSMVIHNYSNRNERIGPRTGINGPIRFLFLAREDMSKGQELAIRVVEELVSRGQKSILKITGTSNNYAIRNSSYIEQLGWITEEEKFDLMDKTDIILSPSLYEGSSMTVIESIVNGIPCICSEASRETIGIPSLVVESRDEEVWADRIEELIDNEEYLEVTEKLSQISKKYSKEENIHLWGELYASMVE